MSSLGGNGVKVQYSGIPTFGFPPELATIPTGNGGGCVTEGPFKE
jgi:tyrosinase